jgi:hypothetical protein
MRIKISIKQCLLLTAFIAAITVYAQSVHSQSKKRVLAARLSADSWTAAELKSLSHDSYYMWVDDLGPKLSIEYYARNMLSQVSHLDLHWDASVETLGVASTIGSVRTIQLCGTRLANAELEDFARVQSHCYIAGYNNGLPVEFNVTAKKSFPWRYGP